MDFKKLAGAVDKASERFQPAMKQAGEVAQGIRQSSGAQAIQTTAKTTVNSLQAFEQRNPVTAEIAKIQGRLAAKSLAAKMNPRAAALFGAIETVNALAPVARELAGNRNSAPSR